MGCEGRNFFKKEVQLHQTTLHQTSALLGSCAA